MHVGKNLTIQINRYLLLCQSLADQTRSYPLRKIRADQAGRTQVEVESAMFFRKLSDPILQIVFAQIIEVTDPGQITFSGRKFTLRIVDALG